MRWTTPLSALLLTLATLNSSSASASLHDNEASNEEDNTIITPKAEASINEEDENTITTKAAGLRGGSPPSAGAPPAPPAPPAPENQPPYYAAPESYNAVTIQYLGRYPINCIGNSNQDRWLDVKTSCYDYTYAPEVEYTRSSQLRDIHSNNQCLDTQNKIYGNGKAYPSWQSCRSNQQSQKFYFVREAGTADTYKIMTLVRGKWMFAGEDQDHDLVFEDFRNCRTCQSFRGHDQSLNALFPW